MILQIDRMEIKEKWTSNRLTGMSQQNASLCCKIAACQDQESTTTRKAGGLDFPAPMSGERQKHFCALIVAVVTGCIVPPWRDLKTTNQTMRRRGGVYPRPLQELPWFKGGGMARL